jgi:hypothetical protein
MKHKTMDQQKLQLPVQNFLHLTRPGFDKSALGHGGVSGMRKHDDGNSVGGAPDSGT